MKNRKELRRSWIKRGTKPLPAVNVARQAKRRREYAAAIGSARFRRLRLARFAFDGWRCTERVYASPDAAPFYPPEFEAKRDRAGAWTIRCLYTDESETGSNLVAEHKTYARLGNELLEDLRTRCRWCDRRGTPQERANHAHGFRRTVTSSETPT